MGDSKHTERALWVAVGEEVGRWADTGFAIRWGARLSEPQAGVRGSGGGRSGALACTKLCP